ncbi:hypothetical protein FOC4_g10012422 [Fusarium odoratissimum]|uniref:Uncharacterized protein n=1 Tax=Fusarium oxysporum f. sp. cubense (strain race 4) TaxID=2502994 RepID=N1RR19_FUSC4|nr:hypothetical protein FOC4_g10012422 [Fusarium odoratissimum]
MDTTRPIHRHLSAHSRVLRWILPPSNVADSPPQSGNQSSSRAVHTVYKRHRRTAQLFFFF